MKTISKTNESVEIDIKKSKFIGLIYKINSQDEAIVLLEKIAIEYNTATHVCFAYVVDNIERCFDDGEPSGTAGKPLLNVIKQNKLTNVLIVVVRYFGGIKLGAGGLTRAYNETACEVLKKAEICEIKEVYNIFLHIQFDEAFNLYVLTNLGYFAIKERIGNDFILECSKENLDETLNSIKKFHITNLETKLIKV